MSARYGDRTRSGDAVSQAGRRVTSGGGGVDVYEEEFLAPGTWTWPGKCNYVEVLVVGGGGGAGRLTLHGGGGGVGVFTVPVSAPVPVTIGAGGAAGSPAPTTNGEPGGKSAFGPLGPGPIPTISADTAWVGGGQGGIQTSPTAGLYYTHHERGSAGSAANDDDLSLSSSFGSGSIYNAAVPVIPGPQAPLYRTSGGAGGNLAWLHAGYDRYGYGAGSGGPNATKTHAQSGIHGTIANLGHGGWGIPSANYDGSSGRVIVRWYE